MVTIRSISDPLAQLTLADLSLTDLSFTDLPLNALLASVAALLLLFVRGGVVYLSAVEWRDRRRRTAAAVPPRKRRP